jgi:hypothetical protein
MTDRDVARIYVALALVAAAVMVFVVVMFRF